MTQDEALAVLVKLVGDKTRCFELIKSVREAFPGQSMQWCIEKAISDVQQTKSTVKPNPKLSRWGGDISSNPTSQPAQTITTAANQESPSVTVSLPDLAALAKAKIQAPVQPASIIIKNRLDFLTKDRSVSDRLVARIRIANPDRSEQWCYEKAVLDLERDRF